MKRKVRYKMATSGITANFYTDDPKAANAIVHALFTETSSPRRMPPRSRFEVKHSPSSNFDYTEWRRENLFVGETVDSLMDKAKAMYADVYAPAMA